MNDTEYVSKETFESRILILERENTALHKRIDDLQESISRGNTIIGISLGLFAILLAGLQVAIAFAPLIISAVK